MDISRNGLELINCNSWCDRYDKLRNNGGGVNDKQTTLIHVLREHGS